jgi:hypothetical protein
MELVRIAQSEVAAARRQTHVNVPMDRGDRARVEVLVVDQENVIVRVPAVLVAPCELQCEDMPCQAAPAVTRFQAARSASTSLDSGSSRSCGTVIVTRLAAWPPASQVVSATRSSSARRRWILAEQTGHSQTLPHVSRPQ